MTGSVSQIEWAERVKSTLSAESDRFVRTYQKTKRPEVMARKDAGCLVHQGIMLAHDGKAIRRDLANN